MSIITVMEVLRDFLMPAAIALIVYLLSRLIFRMAIFELRAVGEDRHDVQDQPNNRNEIIDHRDRQSRSPVLVVTPAQDLAPLLGNLDIRESRISRPSSRADGQDGQQ